MHTFWSLCCLLFLASSVRADSPNPPAIEPPIWVLDGHYPAVWTGCDTMSFSALSEDRMSLEIYSPVEMIHMISLKLPLPGQLLVDAMINDTDVDEIAAVTHDSYITILRFGEFKTIPYPVAMAASLFVVGNLACVVPAPKSKSIPMGQEELTNVVCVNAVNRTYKICPYKVPAGSHGYTDIALQRAYIVDANSAHIHMFNVTNDCINYIKSDPAPTGHYGNHAWFSSDSSRVLLSNGQTLSTTDLSPLGHFNGTGQDNIFKSIDQMPKGNRAIAALRFDSEDKVFYYTWPGLQENGTIAIPSDSKVELVSASQLIYCGNDFSFVVGSYRVKKSGDLRTAIAFVKYL